MEDNPERRNRMDRNKTTIGSMIFRRQRLEAKYKQIEKLLSGSDKKYGKLIKTTAGRYSKPRIKKFVDELTEDLAEYRSYKEACGNFFWSKMKPVVLPKKERDFFEAYFRVVTGLALYNNNCPDGKLCAPGTWNAIMERIDDIPVYRERAELYRDMICSETIGFLEDYPSRIPRGIYYDLMSAYWEVTGGSLHELASKKDEKRAFELMETKEADLIKKERRSPGTIDKIRDEEEAELLRYHAEIEEKIENGEYDMGETDEYYEPEEPDELEIEEYRENIPFYDKEKNVREWREYFCDKEQFKNDCRLIMENIVEMSNEGDLRDEVRNALFLYLEKNRITKWLDDDAYFTVYAYLNKVLRGTERKLENRS